MRVGIDAAKVRGLLRQASNPIVRVSDVSEWTDQDLVGIILLDELFELSADDITRISSVRDLGVWASREVSHRLGDIQVRSSVGYAHPGWQLLVGILVDHLLSSELEFDLTPALT